MRTKLVRAEDVQAGDRFVPINFDGFLECPVHSVNISGDRIELDLSPHAPFHTYRGARLRIEI